MSRKKKRQVSKGTGKRYISSKPKPQAMPIRRTPSPPSYAEQMLRKRIGQFGLGKQFSDDFEKAFELYMGPGSIQQQGDQKILVLDEEENELPGFQEWYYFDYVLKSGDRIIDLFAQEEKPQLPEAQRKMLADWMATNRLRLLETVSVEPGVGESMQDLLSGEILTMNDISFSYNGIRWSVFLARPLLTEGKWHFTGNGMMLTPFEKARILKIAQELWAAYREKHPQPDLLDFYRDHSFDLRRAVKEIVEERSRPKALYSAEGHPAVAARAEFALQGDPREVQNALDEAEEYVCVNEQDEGEFSGCLHYQWLLRGRSSVPEAPEPHSPRDGLLLSNRWTAGPGEPDYLTLGDLYLCWEELTLSVISKERLAAGKKLLKDILGRRLEHRRDRFEDLREYWDNVSREEKDEFNVDDDSSFQAEFDDEELNEDVDQNREAELVHEEIIERMTRRWLDAPGKGGVTPREEAQTPEGREELRERLKILEFMEDQALKSGKRPPMRVDIIREELGL